MTSPSKTPEAKRSYYLKTRDRAIERERLRAAKHRKWINELKKNTPCSDCGQFFDPVCMDYHHINGEDKLMSIGRMSRYSKESILKEIGKCLLICSNCHRIRTWK